MSDPRLLRDIQTAERCVLHAYRDSLGLWTIGWGHLLDQSQDWTGHVITQAEADATLIVDIDIAEEAAVALPEFIYLDTDCRRNAMSELIFNMGGHWFGFHHTRQAITDRRWQDVHDGLLASAWATQVHATRANRIANYMLTGAYPQE